MLKKFKTILGVGIASIAVTCAIAPEAKADRKQECFMINSAGEYVNLSSICYATPPQRVNTTNNNQVAPRSTEVSQPRYDVRTYYDYGSSQHRQVEFSQPYFNSYRYYTQPVFVPVPYSGYYYPGANFGIGYTNRNFGVGFGYNTAPRRGYYNRRYRNNFRRGYNNYRYRGNYRDRSGTYYYNRNGMKIRYR